MSRFCFFIFSLLLLISVVLAEKNKNIFNFHQTDYIMDFERMELARYNKKDVKLYQMRTYKYNRTCPLVNMTLVYNVDVRNELQIVVQAYKFMSNEYRLFPIRLEVNFCDAVKNNLVGCGRFLKCGNFTGCPLYKDVRYFFCNWSPDQDQFPPYIPNGQYMLELQGLFHNVELWVIHAYGIVSRPITKK